MLVQLHWQNESKLSQTMMIMQGEINSAEDQAAWVELCRKKIEERKAECPEGWIPMVCTDTSEHFEWAVTPAKVND